MSWYIDIPLDANESFLSTIRKTLCDHDAHIGLDGAMIVDGDVTQIRLDGYFTLVQLQGLILAISSKVIQQLQKSDMQ